MKLYKNLSEASKQREEVRALKITVKDDIFPEELLDFIHLEELYLEGNCKAMLSSPNWTHLRVLSIKWPSFQGVLTELFCLPRLENLKLIKTPLSKLLLPLGNIPSPLKSLTIKDCGLRELSPEINMLWGLTELNLSGNKLSALPESFIDLKYLSRLNLDGNEFRKFPDLVKAMPALRHLSIDQNKFSTEEKERIQRNFHLWPS